MNFEPLGKFLARTKYRIDLGSFPIPYTILAVSVFGASDKLSAVTGISSRMILLVGIPSGLVLVLLLGWFLDKIKFPHSFQEEVNKRNEMLGEISKKVNK